jgi:predicted ATPase/DNA-binding XRE family transcriptional regulator
MIVSSLVTPAEEEGMSSRANPPFSRLLIRHRIAAGLTQEQLAEGANLSVRGISDLERGMKTRPHVHTVEVLADALDLTPDEREVFQSSVSRERGISAVLASSTALPAEPTALIGREDQQSEVERLLCVEHVRLVTLTGPGGVGKTSLAVRVAAALADRYAEGTACVGLAAVRDPSLVVPALTRSLGLRSPGSDLEGLLDYLRDRELLLVLDNLEHLDGIAPLVGEILASCRLVQVVATSRSRLRLRAEQVFDVPPLVVPALSGVHRADDAARFPAVALFVERARAVKHDFQLTEANTSAVVAICQRMDGLPLGIELAAARVALLPPHVLLARLAHSLGILTQGAHDAPERQRTMRDAIAWSYDLLSDAERLVLRRLAVFSGGADLDAVDGVCAEELGHDALEETTSLVEKQLLVAHEHESGVRVRALEVIREFALEKLSEAGEDEKARRGHAEYFLRLSGEAEAELWGSEQAQWFRRLDTEQANLRLALEWGLGHGEEELALRIAGRLWRFWIWHGDYRGWRRVLEAGLADAPHVPAAVRVRALFAAAWLAQHDQDYATATALSEENLRISRQLDDPLAIRHALAVLGMAARAQGRPADAIPLFAETVQLCRTLDSRQFLAPSLFNLGLAMAEVGERDRAVPLIEEALGLFRTQGEKYIVATACRSLGHILLKEGRPAEAEGLFQESLGVSVETGHRVGTAESLESLSVAAGLCGRTEFAATLLGASEAYRSEIGRHDGGDGRDGQEAFRLTFQAHLSELKTRLGEDAWRALREMGRSMALADALSLALGEDSSSRHDTQEDRLHGVLAP